MTLIKYKIASWDIKNIKNYNEVSEEIEFASEELGSKDIAIGVFPKSKVKLSDIDKYQLLTTIQGSKIYLGDQAGVSYICILYKSEVIVVAKQIDYLKLNTSKF